MKLSLANKEKFKVTILNDIAIAERKRKTEVFTCIKQKIIYGNHATEVSPAACVRGVLCKSADGDYVFRVYAPDHSFVDYELRHDDLSVIIAEDELTSFYCIGEDNLLDHSPSVLGLAEVTLSNT